VFEHLTEPLVKFYEDRDLLVRCDATKPVDAVTADILTSIDARNRRSSIGGVGL
jgi:adenylate kinase family enzyme